MMLLVVFWRLTILRSICECFQLFHSILTYILKQLSGPLSKALEKSRKIESIYCLSSRLLAISRTVGFIERKRCAKNHQVFLKRT